MTLRLNSVLRAVDDDAPLKGLNRILWTSRDSGGHVVLLVVINIPPMEGRNCKYFRGPVWLIDERLQQVVGGLEAGLLAVDSAAPLVPLSLLSDDEIRARYPVRVGRCKGQGRSESAPLDIRDRMMSLALPILKYVAASPEEAYEAGGLRELVAKRVLETGLQRRDVHNAVNRGLAYGCHPQSWLPALFRCGGEGKQREPRDSNGCPKLGRPNNAERRGEVPRGGVHLDAKAKTRCAMVSRRFAVAGKSQDDAYLHAMGAWWSSGSVFVNGKPAPVLLPQSQRPTRAQFERWAREGSDRRVSEARMKERDVRNNVRAKLGTAMDGLRGVGQRGLIDATSNDVTLVMAAAPLQAVGTAHRIEIVDGMSGVIFGLYCGFDAPSSQTALLAICNGAMSKVDFCKRFGLTVTEEQFPSLFCLSYRADNGECRSAAVMGALTACGSGVDFVPSGVAIGKGPIESAHKVTQAMLDHTIDGTTRGRRSQRGEDHSAIDACWTWFEYMAQLIEQIVEFNTKEDAFEIMRRHPYRTEMLRDKVPPSRAAIHAWCVKNHRVSSAQGNPDLLRVCLLPSTRAVVKQTGIYLVRPDRGAKVEFVRGPRFSGARAEELGWHRGDRPDFTIHVRYDEADLDTVWYADTLGLHPLKNVSRDEVQVREMGLRELLCMQDDESVAKVINQGAVDQQHLGYITGRDEQNAKNRKRKRAAIAESGKVSKATLKSRIEENRSIEAP